MKLKKDSIQTVALILIGILLSCGILSLLGEDSLNEIEASERAVLVSMQTHTTNANEILQGHENKIRKQVMDTIKVDDLYGTLLVSERSFRNDLYYGDSSVQMDKGLAHYAKSGFPGQGKPILIAGHNGTEFKGIENFEIGDIVSVDTIYGNYTYEIDSTEIMNEAVANSGVIREILDKESETLIMYTCYPFTVVDTPDRYFVYAHYVSGPEVREK